MAERQERQRAMEQVRRDRMWITEDGLKTIGAYAYKGGNYTPVDNLLNKYVWTPGVELLPRWLAPNLVTLSGLLLIFLGYGVVSVHSPDLYREAPRWTYAFNGFCLFAYQLLDALDGKQARRTGSSSPLGQLFDHGCDSVSTTFIALSVATTARLGFGVRTVLLLFSGLVPFWSAQWAEYHTHTLAHSLGWIGVTEAQLTGVVMMLAAAAFGPGIFEKPIGFDMPAWYCGRETSCPATFQDPLLFTQLLSGTIITLQCVVRVATAAKDKAQAFLQVVPIVMHAVLGSAWAALVPHSHPRLVLFSIGMSFTYITCLMIVASMSQMRYPVFHSILVPLPILFAIGKSDLLPRYNDVLLGAYCWWCIYKLYKYAQQVIQEITQYLGIYAFVLGPRKRD